MTNPRRFPPRARTRAVLLASAVMAGLLSVVLWYSASTMALAGSPVDPDGQVLDRSWDTRRLGAAVVMFNVALVALFAALVPPSGMAEASQDAPDAPQDAPDAPQDAPEAPAGDSEAPGAPPVQEAAHEN